MTPLCPHCRKPGIRNLALRWSTRESPAQCAYCGGLSHVLASTSGAIAMFMCLSLLGSVALAVVLESVVMAAPGLVLAGLGNVWMWRRCELFPIDRKAAQTAARAGWAATALATVLALLG